MYRATQGVGILGEVDGPHPLLETRNLGRIVGAQWLWRGLELTLKAGEHLALRGPSGSGKTLVMRALAGLDDPQEGQILFKSRPLSDWDTPAYRSEVSYLHQRPALFEGTVETNLRRPYALKVHKDKAFERSAALDLLQQVGRDERFLKLSADTLSGGEGQLVALVRALQLGPSVLLLDEATASLDPETVSRVETLLKNWTAGAERGCIWTSHDPAQLARVASRSYDVKETSRVLD